MIEYFHIPDTQDFSGRCTGAGKKGLLIIIAKSEVESSIYSKLNDIIKSIHFHPNEDVYILPFFDHELTSLSQLAKIQPLKNIIVFGIHNQLSVENLEVPLYKKVPLENFNLFAVEALQAIMMDPSKKLKLWQLLKENFL
ncbi:MAG TPA: hypothetical protein PKC30_13415 [Saprospiraceae bacterium]|nr:hypothetical protein [Saprospiraceae bacterium]